MLDRAEWSRTLYQIYTECRMGPGWPSIYELHDAEDKNYFMMLEDEVDDGKITVKAWD